MSSLSGHFEKIKQDIELTDDIKRSVMASVNVQAILTAWNVRPVLRNGQWNGYCPDHFLHDGCVSHAPKWSMNSETGDCICFTSHKTSNFIYVAKRLYKCETIKETIDRLLEGKDLIIEEVPVWVVNDNLRLTEQEEEKKRIEKLEKNIEYMKKYMVRSILTDDCLEYFAKDGIHKETLDFLGVTSITSGYYDGRAIIPFLNEKIEMSGYIAVSFYPKEKMIQKEVDKWCKLNGKERIKEAEEFFTKNYRKTIYCPGFLSRNHLYGYYEVLNGDKNLEELVIVEGERDAMKLLQEGIDCVSIHGTYLKDEQLKMLHQINPKNIYLGFDMDKAGNEATETIYNKLFGKIENIYVLNFPNNKDPKSFNGNEIKELMNYSKNNNIYWRIL
jgi:5S rRNA maturation endonuclease (ribonuclease M5)